MQGSGQTGSRSHVTIALGCAVVFIAAFLLIMRAPESARGATATYTMKRLQAPARTNAYDSTGKLAATFTDGSRTVTLRGPVRTFTEDTAAASVTHSTWVRLYPQSFAGKVDVAWLDRALADRSPDMLGLGMQYVAGAANVFNTSGLRIAGDADYGPLLADGTREEGSDFNDFLGLDWTYGTQVDANEAGQLGSLDCSGFVRMVYGFRSGLALSLASTSTTLPRRAVQMDANAAGVRTITNTGAQSTAFSRLGIGDLVFFDASTNDGTDIDHVGIYLGRDSAGHHRFVSSRKGINGPTLGDYRGASVLDGTGLYASAFRSARRV